MKSPAVTAAPALINWQQASVAAAGWCSAVLLISVTGALIAQGHDGLAYTLGISGAAFLWASLIVPVISGSPGATSLPAYLSACHGSRVTGTLSSIVLLVALTVLLAAEFVALAGVLGLAGLALPLAFAITLAAAGGGCALALGGQQADRAAATLTVLVAAMVIAALAAMSYQDGPGALVSIPAMDGISGLEQMLLEKRLADPATFKPHAVPFLRTSALNFAMLVLCLSLGLAMLATPRISSRTGAATANATWALVFVSGIIVLLPPLAAAAKRSLLSLFASGVRPGALPGWMSNPLQNGMLQICGSPSSDPAVFAKACGKGVGPQGLMRWQDAAFAPDALLFAGLQAASPAATVLMLGLVGLAIAAVVWSSRRIVSLGIDAATVHGPQAGPSTPVAVAILTASAFVAYARPVDALTLMTWSASFAAAALAPATLAAIFIRKPSAIAANAAIVAGALVAAALIVAAQYAPLELFAWSGGSSSAPAAVTRKLATLQDAWAAAADGPGKAALRMQAEKLSRDNLNWFGVRPLSAGVFGLALGSTIVLIGGVVSLLTRRKPNR